MKLFLSSCALAVGLLLSACGGGNDNAPAAAPSEEPAATEQGDEFTLADGTVAIRAGDPTFRGPATLPPGPVSFTLNNEGRFPHELRLVELDEDDPPLHEIANRAPREIPDLVTQIGMIRQVRSREVSPERIEVELETGRYGFLCLLRITNSQETHAALGMSWEFTVSE